MKKILFVLCAVFFARIGFSQTWQTSLASDVRVVMQEQHSGSVNYVKYSSDEKYIFTADEQTAKIWEAESGLLIRSVDKPHGGHCDFSPDGKKLVYVATDGNLHCMDIMTGADTKVFEGKIKVDTSYNGLLQPKISFSADGSMYAVLIDPWTIHIYDAQTNKVRTKLSDKSLYYNSIMFSRDSKYLLETSQTHFLVYDIAASKTKVSISQKRLDLKGSVDTSFNNKYAAAALRTGKVIIIDIEAGKIVNTIPVDTEYQLKFVHFTNDNTLVTTSYNKGIDEWNYLTGKKIAKIKDSPMSGPVCVAKNGKSFLKSDFRECGIYSLPDNKLIKSFSDFSKIRTIRYFPNSDKIYIVSDGAKDSTYIVNVYNTSFEKLDSSPAMWFWKNHSIFDGGVYYIANGDDEKNTHIYCYDFETKQSSEVMVIKKNSEGINLSTNTVKGRLIFTTNWGKKVYVYNLEKGKLLKSFSGLKDKDHDFADIIVSANGRYIIFDTFEQDTKVFDCNKNKMIPLKGDDPSFSPDEKYCMTYDLDESGIVNVYDTSTWEIVKQFEGMHGGIMSQDGKYFATGSRGSSAYNDTYGNIWIYHFGSQKLVKRIPNGLERLQSFFNKENSKFTVLTGNTVKTFSVETGELLSSTMIAKNGDWITYTPEGYFKGYFNGSPDGLNNFVHLVNGMEITGLDQLANVYYRPDLVAAKLRGEDISAQDGFVSLNSAIATGDAPSVQFTSTPASTQNRDVTVNFSVQDAGGGIGAVYLSLNGKVIQLQAGSRKFTLEGAENVAPQNHTVGKNVQFSHTVSLSSGENIIEAYATNAAGVIESRHAQAKVSWQGATAKPNLYVLAVGVNKYRDRSLWLNYAVPDATSIADSFKNMRGNLYQSVNVVTIFDADVTAGGISTAFNSLASKVGVDDVFIFYLSGHGTTYTDGDYYFIPVDFRFRNADSIPESAISKHFITENLSKIKAQKSLVMLDTCNSGAFISTGARGMAEKTAIDRLSRATGQATIAASSDTQSAMEGYEGHGIFTYVILEGLSGKADTNKDGYISLSELSAYAEEKVPDYSYSKWGYEQYPQIDLRKQSNFPLVGK